MSPRTWPKPTKPEPSAAPVTPEKWSQRGSATVVVAPTAGILPGQNLKSWENWRAFLHQITPIVVTTLVTFGIVTDTQAALWIPLVFAVIDPLLSVGNTTDKLRRIVYGVAGLLQVGGIATGLVVGVASGGNGLIAAGIGAGVTILSTLLARFYTPTTTMQSA